MKQITFLVSDCVPPGEVWAVRAIRHEIVQQWDADRKVLRVGIATDYERIGRIVNLASDVRLV